MAAESRTGGRDTAGSSGTLSVPFFAATGDEGSAFLDGVDEEAGAVVFLSGVAGERDLVRDARGGDAGGGLAYRRAAEGEVGGDLADGGIARGGRRSGKVE